MECFCSTLLCVPAVCRRCLGRDTRSGTVADSRTARPFLLQATQRNAHRANVEVQAADAALLPAAKKLRFTSGDEMVRDFRSRIEPAENSDASVQAAVI